MKWMLWSLVIVVVAAGVLILLAYVVGRQMPEDHVAEAERVIPASPEALAERIFRVEDQPRWRGSVDAIEIASREAGQVRYRERSGGDAIDFLLRQDESRHTFESEIVSTDLPFGGRWRFTLEPRGDQATLLRIREEGFVRPPLFRSVAKYVFGHDATLRRYLTDMAASFEAKPVDDRHH
jgi:hypothetical protein